MGLLLLKITGFPNADRGLHYAVVLYAILLSRMGFFYFYVRYFHCES